MKKESDMLTDKHNAAVVLGRSGGKARALSLTPKRRKEIAVQAAKARWDRGRKVEEDSNR